MSISLLYWREAGFLWLALLPLLVILYAYYQQKKNTLKLVDQHLLAWVKTKQQSTKQLFSAFLLLCAWCLFCLALAGPRTVHWLPPSLQADNVNLLVIMDFSGSMRAKDGRYSRIEQTQKLLQHWLKNVPESLRMGLMVFSAQAHVLLKPTEDKLLLKHFIKQLPKFRPPVRGNNLAAALVQAGELLSSWGGQHYVLLISDGDMGKAASKKALSTMEQLNNKNRFQLTIVGVGQSEPVPVPLTANKSLMVNNKIVLSRRQTHWLKAFAQQTQGAYYPAQSVSELTLTELLAVPDTIIDADDNDKIIWNEWFFIPLLAGALCFLLAIQLNHRAASVRLLSISLLLIFAGCSERHPPSRFKQSLLNGDFTQARILAEQAEGYEARFAQGVACYRLADYACAVQAFSTAAWSTSGKSRRARAVFNLAHSYYKSGDYTQASVLFKDAQQLGLSTELTQMNIAFADSLAAAVRHRLADITKRKQRIDWLAASRKIPEALAERMVDALNLSQAKINNRHFANMPLSEQQALIRQGVHYQQTHQPHSPLADKNFWVKASQQKQAQQTAELFNHLMASETGLHYVPDKALIIKELRPW